MAIRTTQLAFPTAVGYGRNALGGSGGTLIFVTNLNDSGTGSLRAALEASGRRIVVPLVGGRVNLTSPINIDNPYLTYYGHAGISGNNLTVSRNNQTGYAIAIRSHDVIFRYMTVRHSVDYTSDQNADALRVIGSNAHDIIIDHCSLSWSPDGNLDVTEGAHNITVQNCILHQCLGSEKNSLNKYQVESISYFNNILSSTEQRNPALASNSVSSYFPDDPNMNPKFEVVNNIIFRYEYATTFHREYPAKLNWVNNRLLFDRNKRRGLNSGNFTTINEPNPENRVQIYMKGNTDDKWRPTISEPVDWEEEFSLSQGTQGSSYEDNPPVDWVEGTGGIYYRIPPQFRVYTPVDTPIFTEGVAITDAGEVGDEVLFNHIKSTVGASLPERDSVDSEVITIIEDYITDYDSSRINSLYPRKDGSGENTFPTLSNKSLATDSNGNGIPDDWEASNMSGADANDLAPSGYTYIEEYYNELSGGEPANFPVITRTDGNPSTYTVGDVLPDPIVEGTWTDEEDGSGSATLGGDIVDINTEGVYNVTLSHTDTDGNTGTLVIPITVQPLAAENTFYTLTPRQILNSRFKIKQLTKTL